MSELIDPKLIRPDPNQPREEFDPEVIQGYADSLGLLDQLEAIEIDENNIIIRHEQLWRAALLKGLDKVRVIRKTGLSQRERFERQLADHSKDIGVIEKIWSYATGVVNINADAEYTKSDIKEMYENDYIYLRNFLDKSHSPGQGQISGQAELSRRIGVNSDSIGNYLDVFRVPRNLQEEFLKRKGNGELNITYIREVARIRDEEEKHRIANIILEDLEKPKEEKTFPITDDLLNYVSAFNKQADEIIKEEAKTIKIPIAKPSKKTVQRQALTEAQKQERERKRQENLEKRRKKAAEAKQRREAELEKARENGAKAVKEEAQREIKKIKESAKEIVKEELKQDPTFIREVKRTIIDPPIPQGVQVLKTQLEHPKIRTTIMILAHIPFTLGEKLRKYQQKNNISEDEAVNRLLAKALGDENV